MATAFETSASSYISEQDILHRSNESSPGGGLDGFDFTSYIDCASSPWASLEEEMPTPNTSSPTSSSSPYPPEIPHNRRTSYNKSEENETVKLNRRREQNRLSQKNFRQRKEKLYDEVVAQLEAEREVIARLKSEITILNSAVLSLQREKQTSLDAVVRLCRSMYDFPEPRMKYGHEA